MPPPMTQAPTTIEPSPPTKVIAKLRCSSRLSSHHGSCSPTDRTLQPSARGRTERPGLPRSPSQQSGPKWLFDALAALPVDTGDDRGHVLGVGAVEVQLHLARCADRRQDPCASPGDVTYPAAPCPRRRVRSGHARCAEAVTVAPGLPRVRRAGTGDITRYAAHDAAHRTLRFIRRGVTT